MKILEFENTQGINLQYPVASVVDRVISYFIDIVVLAVIIGILYLFFAGSRNLEIYYILVLAPVFIFYSLILELLNDGKSIGKMIMGLKVIRIDGKPVKPSDYLMRWMFRWVDIYGTSGSLAAITIGASPKSQRIGDMLADTTVIRVKDLRVSLNKLKRLSELAEYQAKYPQVVELNEDQIVAIKNVLVRKNKYNNKGSIELMNDLAEKVSKLLSTEKPPNPEAFLTIVVKDYISLTR